MQDPPSTASWDRYWKTSPDEAAYCSEGISDAATRGFWNDVFRSAGETAGRLDVVDFCSGNGAILRAAVEFWGRKPPGFCCIDRSPAAIRSLHGHFPAVRGIVCDARSTPFADETFTLAASQFGIEYAGLETVGEMLRVLAPGGRIALLLHHFESPISAKCRANLEAMKRFEASDYLPTVRRMFEAGFSAAPGIRVSVFPAASAAFLAAHSRVEALLRQQGRDTCGGTLQRLHEDISRMHARIRFQDPPAVLQWLGYMEEEVAAYADRMQAQVRAAVTDEAFHDFGRGIATAGMRVQRQESLATEGHEAPLAWAFVAAKAT